MKLLIETYVTTFIVVLSVMICSSFIKAELQINSAKDFHASCIALIEASDFDEDVIISCQENASKRGYTLKVKNTVPELEANKVICGRCKTIYNAPTDIAATCPNCSSSSITRYIANRLYLVELDYKIDLLGDSQIGVVNGYAR